MCICITSDTETFIPNVLQRKPITLGSFIFLILISMELLDTISIKINLTVKFIVKCIRDVLTKRIK